MFKLFIIVNLVALMMAAPTTSTRNALTVEQADNVNNAAIVVLANLGDVKKTVLFSTARDEITKVLEGDVTCATEVQAAEDLAASLRQYFCALKTNVPNGEESLKTLKDQLVGDLLFPKVVFARLGVFITPPVAWNQIVHKFKTISGYTF